MQKTDDHWETYYRSKDIPTLPSQFAVFVLGESKPAAVVEFGCGSGRDSFFFARQHIPTVGIDKSGAAVDLCSSKAKEQGMDHLHFLRADVNDPSLPANVNDKLGELSGTVLVYARFFVHAINSEEEACLLSHASSLLSIRGGMFACEFRTVRDKSMEKATPDHYRRFIDPVDFLSAARDHGLRSVYSVEGFGFAKYKQDDAYVARVLLTPA